MIKSNILKGRFSSGYDGALAIKLFCNLNRKTKETRAE